MTLSTEQQAAYEARYAEYCALLDAGMHLLEVCQAVGISESTGRRWHRSYRSARGIPARPQDARWSAGQR